MSDIRRRIERLERAGQPGVPTYEELLDAIQTLQEDPDDPAARDVGLRWAQDVLARRGGEQKGGTWEELVHAALVEVSNAARKLDSEGEDWKQGGEDA